VKRLPPVACIHCFVTGARVVRGKLETRPYGNRKVGETERTNIAVATRIFHYRMMFRDVSANANAYRITATRTFFVHESSFLFPRVFPINPRRTTTTTICHDRYHDAILSSKFKILLSITFITVAIRRSSRNRYPRILCDTVLT